MRVIVCGGRDFADSRAFHDAKSLIEPGSTVVHGCCRGADEPFIRYLMHGSWALVNRIREERHPADWARFHHGAGPIRNQEMIDAGADLCIAFPGGRGTADCMRRCEKAGIPVRRIES